MRLDKDLFKNAVSDDRKRLPMIAVGVTAFMVLDILFVLGPLVGAVNRLRPQIFAVSDKIGSINQEITLIDVKRKKVEALRLEWARYEKRFPKDEEIPSLLRDLSEVAANTGVAIIAISPTRQEVRHPVKAIEKLFYQIPIQIRAQGGYHQFGSFINNLERLDRFIELRHIEIKRNPETPRTHLLTALASTYVLRE